jgi:hypothetical protein
MSDKQKIREKWLTVRLSDIEHAELQRHFTNSTCRGLSDYVRKLILSKPINVKYRNASVDDFLADMLALKKELNALGNNFNQSVHKLHTLDHVPEIHQWAMTNERSKEALFQKIDQILNRVNELHKLWFQ